MKKVVVLLVAVFLVGCASSSIEPINVLDTKVIDYPEPGTITTKSIGDRLVAKGVRTTGPALRVTKLTQFNKSDGESSVMTCAASVLPGSLFKIGVLNDKATEHKDAITFDCFGPAVYKLTLSDGKTNWNCNGKINSADICTDGDKYFLYLMGFRAPLKQDFHQVKLTEKTIEGEPNFIQELIYNGRTGNQIKFVYREFSSDMIRAAFSQDVQYDLAQSMTIGFKTLRMEILKANNTEITYKLLNNFQLSGEQRADNR